MANNQSGEEQGQDQGDEQEGSNEMATQIWTRAEEGILKDSLQEYRDTPVNKKAEFIRDKVVLRIKKLEMKKYPPGAINPGGKFYKDWKAKKKVSLTTSALPDGTR